MGRLIREKDWRATPLGPADGWPAPLKTTIRLMLTTQHPIFIFWGPDLLCFYNDAYSRSIGPEKHPHILGEPGREVWADIWDIVGDQIDHVMAGKGSTWNENQLVPIYRHGQHDEVYWTYSYSPINYMDAPNGVGGLLVICAETTEQVLSERRERELAENVQVAIRETQHRVKNNLATIMAIVGLEQRKLGDPAAKAALQRIRGRLDSFVQLYEMMLVAGDDTAIDAGPYISELCNNMRDLVMSKDAAIIDCKVEAVSARLSPDDAVALGAIAVELMTNAVTHAFCGREKGEIIVGFTREPEDFVFTVADNGIGGMKDQPKTDKPSSSTGIGMELVKHYAQSLGGAFDFSAKGDGARAVLRFPTSRELAG